MGPPFYPAQQASHNSIFSFSEFSQVLQYLLRISLKEITSLKGASHLCIKGKTPMTAGYISTIHYVTASFDSVEWKGSQQQVVRVSLIQHEW